MQKSKKNTREMWWSVKGAIRSETHIKHSHISFKSNMFCGTSSQSTKNAFCQTFHLFFCFSAHSKCNYPETKNWYIYFNWANSFLPFPHCCNNILVLTKFQIFCFEFKIYFSVYKNKKYASLLDVTLVWVKNPKKCWKPMTLFFYYCQMP